MIVCYMLMRKINIRKANVLIFLENGQRTVHRGCNQKNPNSAGNMCFNLYIQEMRSKLAVKYLSCNLCQIHDECNYIKPHA